jgi:sortase (surface protein transpeptidase)
MTANVVVAPPDVEGPAETIGSPDSGIAVALVRFLASAVLAFVVYAQFGTALIEGRAQHSIASTSRAVISAPRVGLSDAVLSSDSGVSLTKGPGFVPGYGRPGSNRPVLIVGHRTMIGGPLRHISDLRSGDIIGLRAGDGRRLTYSVERIVVASPHARITESLGPQALYLISASPTGHASSRLVVIARLADKGESPSVSQSVTLPNVPGSRLDRIGAVLVLVALAAGWAVRSTIRPRLTWFSQVITALIALVGLYMFSYLFLASMPRVL